MSYSANPNDWKPITYTFPDGSHANIGLLCALILTEEHPNTGWFMYDGKKVDWLDFLHQVIHPMAAAVLYRLDRISLMSCDSEILKAGEKQVGLWNAMRGKQ